MFELQWPWLLLLAPLPFFAYRFLPAKKQQSAAIYMPAVAHMQEQQLSNATSKPKLLLLALAWLCLIAAISKPVLLGEAIEINNNGRDMFVAVDLSGSMKEDDMPLNGSNVNRLQLVKHVLANFIKQRQGDRLGLIVFGSNAFVQAPLTFDLITLQALLNEAQIGFAGEKTAIGEAIGLGIKRLAENPAQARVLILLTDGENTAGTVDPIQAAQLAKQENVVIHTIGIGSTNTRGGFFGFGGYNPSSGLDERTLNQIAQMTGGKFFRATNQDDLQAVYQTINELEKIEQEAEKFRPQKDIFYYPLIACMIFLVLAKISSLSLFNVQEKA